MNLNINHLFKAFVTWFKFRTTTYFLSVGVVSYLLDWTPYLK
jgi:hypothetical protein